MKELIMNVGWCVDHFDAYSENIDGIWASGETMEELKRDVLEAIRLFKKYTPENEIPDL